MSLQCLNLTDPEAGSTAEVLVGLGFNCFRFQVPRGTQRVDVLWSEPQFAEGTRRASGSGIPLLFPFPGRIAGTVFRWQGRDYPLVAGDGRGNAIHGFVLDRPWRVIAQEIDRASGQFQASVDDPQLLERWPADFRITATYRVRGKSLISQFLVENPDDRPLPCGFGTHPYFRIPLGGPKAADCLVKLPVSARWELTGLLPTGMRLAIDGSGGYHQGQRFESLTLDDVFSGLQFEGDWCTASARRPGEPSDHEAAVRPQLSRVRRLHASASRGDLYRALHLRSQRSGTCRARHRRWTACAGPRRVFSSRGRDAAELSATDVPQCSRGLRGLSLCRPRRCVAPERAGCPIWQAAVLPSSLPSHSPSAAGQCFFCP